MTVDLILHGVPNGQDIWGVNNDTHYFSTFYVQKDEKEFLSIETRKVSGKSYTFYNYLKYNGVIASDERAGAYIGITLRFDAYYKNVLNVYHLCEIVYNHLVDTILVKNGDNVKFKITKFDKADNELNEIKKKIVNLINLSASAKDFMPISDSFFKNDAKTAKAFLLDCTSDNVLQNLLKYGKVEVSKYYTSINEAKKLKAIEDHYNDIITLKDKNIQDVNKQNEDIKNEINKYHNELRALKGEIDKLNNSVTEKDEIINKNRDTINEVNSLKKRNQELDCDLKKKHQEIDRLKSELRHYKESKKISDLVKDIKDPLNTLAKAVESQTSHFPHNDNKISSDKDHKKYNYWMDSLIWQVAKIVLLVLIMCLSLYTACSKNQLQTPKENIEYVTETQCISNDTIPNQE